MASDRRLIHHCARPRSRTADESNVVFFAPGEEHRRGSGKRADPSRHNPNIQQHNTLQGKGDGGRHLAHVRDALPFDASPQDASVYPSLIACGHPIPNAGP